MLNVIIIFILISLLGKDDIVSWVLILGVFFLPFLAGPIWLFIVIVFLLGRKMRL